jgi:NDP-sugar pyrophosphorylase family protein
MFERKYNFCGWMMACGRPVHRIKAARDFKALSGRWIYKGDLGGIVEGEHNLSHEGGAWIDYTGMVIDTSRVEGEASVFGDVYGHSKITDRARVARHTMVTDSYIGGHAEIGDRTHVEVMGSVIQGRARVLHNGRVGGCIIDGDALIAAEEGALMKMVRFLRINGSAFQDISEDELYKVLGSYLGPVKEARFEVDRIRQRVLATCSP